jgi:hypothetical protein
MTARSRSAIHFSNDSATDRVTQSPSAAPFSLAPVSVRTVMRRAEPRFVRDACGPLAMFFAGWTLISLGAGIAMSATFGLAVYLHERRRNRPAMIVRLALALVAIRATVGVASGSATAYLAQEIAIDALLSCVVLGSLATARPFSSWFAHEIYPFPDMVRESATYRQVMRTITWVWGAYFLTRGLVRLVALLMLSTDRFALVIALTDAPFLIGLLAWSLYYTGAAFRRSAQRGPPMGAAQAPVAPSPL